MKTIFDIPSNWTWATMGEIADVVGGGTPRTNDPGNYEGGTIPWITPADLSGYTGKHIAHGERYITQKGLGSSSAKMMPAGTILFSSRAPVGYVAIASRSVCTNQGFKSFVLKTQDVLPDYVYWWLKGSKDLAESLASGTTFLELSGAKAKQLPIPIAPPGQQQSIVAEIEKHFSRLDEAVASLKRVKANLKRYKAAVLKAAVEGKLTEDWRLSARAEGRRRAQASELETIPKAGKKKWFIYIIECDDGSYYVGHTADLHARWQAHCESSGADSTRQHPPKYLMHFEECGSREDAVKREKDLKTGFGRTWRKREIDAGRMKPLVHNPANEAAQPVHDEDMQTGSKLLERILAERRIRWPGRGKYKEPMAPDTNNLPPLAEGWVWASLEQLSWDSSYGTSVKCSYENSGPTVLRIPNIESGKLDFGDLKHAPESFEIEQGEELSIGDVLIIRTNGSRSLIGRSAVIRQPVSSRSTYASYLIRFRLEVSSLGVEIG